MIARDRIGRLTEYRIFNGRIVPVAYWESDYVDARGIAVGAGWKLTTKWTALVAMKDEVERMSRELCISELKTLVTFPHHIHGIDYWLEKEDP